MGIAYKYQQQNQNLLSFSSFLFRLNNINLLSLKLL